MHAQYRVLRRCRNDVENEKVISPYIGGNKKYTATFYYDNVPLLFLIREPPSFEIETVSLHLRIITTASAWTEAVVVASFGETTLHPAVHVDAVLLYCCTDHRPFVAVIHMQLY